MGGGRRNGTRHGTAVRSIDIDIGRLSGVAALVRLFPRVRGNRSVIYRLFVRRGAFSFFRFLTGSGSFDDGRLLFRERVGQILFENNFEVFNSLKLAKR